MEFEFYEKMTGANADPNPRVTLTDTTISFNPAAVREFLDPLAKKLKLDCVGYVELGYCGNNEIIGLFPAAEESRKTLCVQQKKGDAARIGASGFIKRFGLKDAGKTYRVLAVEPQEKALYLTFTDEVVPKKQSRPKPEKPSPPPPAVPSPDPPEEDPVEEEVQRIRRKRRGRPPQITRAVASGFSDRTWPTLYPHTGTPDACPKCSGSVFVEI